MFFNECFYQPYAWCERWEQALSYHARSKPVRGIFSSFTRFSQQLVNFALFFCFTFIPASPFTLWRVKCAFRWVTHALLREHNPYRPWASRWALLSCQVHGRDPYRACFTSSRWTLAIQCNRLSNERIRFTWQAKVFSLSLEPSFTVRILFT